MARGGPGFPDFKSRNTSRSCNGNLFSRHIASCRNFSGEGFPCSPPKDCFIDACDACISPMLVRSRMSGTSLAWFPMIACENANNSLTVPKPLAPACNVAKPTKPGASRSVFQSADEKSFLVTILAADASSGRGTQFLWIVYRGRACEVMAKIASISTAADPAARADLVSLCRRNQRLYLDGISSARPGKCR